MGCKWNPVLCLTLIPTVIYTVQTTNCSSNNSIRCSSTYSYDITKTLRDCIVNLFHHVESNSAEKFLVNLANYENKEFEYNVAHDKEPFHNKLYFSGINITGSRRVRDAESPQVSINCQFPKKEIIISCPKYISLVVTNVGPTKGAIYSRYYPDMYFTNISMVVTKHSNHTNNIKKFSATIFYTRLMYSQGRHIWFSEQLTSDRKFELELQFRPAIVHLFLDNINNNEKFFHNLDETFLTQPERDILAAHAKYLGHERQHYYFIPNITLYWFNLRNVMIVGLSNFQSLSFTKLINNSTNTLVVKDISGSMTLDYGCENEKPMELNFIVDSLHISLDYIINEVNVEMRDYQLHCKVTNTRTNSKQEAVIMRQLEGALASSIFPEMKFWRNSNQSTSKYDMKCPLEKFFTAMTVKPEAKSIKQLFSQWIPFFDK